MRGLALSHLLAGFALLFIAACQTGGVIAPEPEAELAKAGDGTEISIAQDITLTLPALPGYPEPYSAFQTVVGQYGERRQAFQAALELAPDTAKIVLIAPSGPRIMEIDWSADGLTEVRSSYAPDELDGKQVLGDIYLSLWPAETIIEHLSLSPDMKTGEISIEAAANGSRHLLKGDTPILHIAELERDAKGRRVQLFTHLERGYSLKIISDESTPE